MKRSACLMLRHSQAISACNQPASGAAPAAPSEVGGGASGGGGTGAGGASTNPATGGQAGSGGAGTNSPAAAAPAAPVKPSGNPVEGCANPDGSALAKQGSPLSGFAGSIKPPHYVAYANGRSSSVIRLENSG